MASHVDPEPAASPETTNVARGDCYGPLIAAIGPMLMRLVCTPDPARDDEARDVAEVAATLCTFLATCHTLRVLPDDQEEVYGCPECLYATRDWDAFCKHRSRLKHNTSTCDRCHGTDGVHKKAGCAGGFSGPLWNRPDFIVPRAEFVGPSIPQFPCAYCGLTFISSPQLVAHTRAHHLADVNGSNWCPRRRPMLPRRQFSEYGPGLQPHHADDPKRPARLLYQCPDCAMIFSSWSQWEVHVRATKHSQPYCIECGKILGKFSTDTTNHGVQVGHYRVVGSQPSKETHLRLVDTTVRRYDSIVDSPEALHPRPNDMSRHVYQCPLSTCSAVFPDAAALTQHIDDSEHTVHRCELCGETVRADDGSIHTHPHAIPNLPCDLWFLRDPSESCRIEAGESELLAYFPTVLERCDHCTTAIFSQHRAAHEGSDECIAARALRIAAWEHGSRKGHQKQGAAAPTVSHAAPASPGQMLPSTQDHDLDIRRFTQAALFGGFRQPGAQPPGAAGAHHRMAPVPLPAPGAPALPMASLGMAPPPGVVTHAHAAHQGYQQQVYPAQLVPSAAGNQQQQRQPAFSATAAYAQQSTHAANAPQGFVSAATSQATYGVPQPHQPQTTTQPYMAYAAPPPPSAANGAPVQAALLPQQQHAPFVHQPVVAHAQQPYGTGGAP